MNEIIKKDGFPDAKVGLLALQGAFDAHGRMCRSLGAQTRELKIADDFDGCTHIILPGGESTTFLKLFDYHDLRKPLLAAAQSGVPILATCAGLILLSNGIEGREQESLDVIDVSVERNAYGRQVHSFETELALEKIGGSTFHGVFIRAPKIVSVGKDVEVLSEHDGSAVLVRQGNILGSTFHPELSGDRRIHEYFLSLG
ncbi:MAG TPA: pyridoxal 5'-phosphate synthase glutaminase subunit PdxT [bacterium]